MHGRVQLKPFYRIAAAEEVGPLQTETGIKTPKLEIASFGRPMAISKPRPVGRPDGSLPICMPGEACCGEIRSSPEWKNVFSVSARCQCRPWKIASVRVRTLAKFEEEPLLR